LASEGTASHLEAIETFIGMKIPVHEAEIELFDTDLSEGFRTEKRNQRTGQNNRRSNYRSKKVPRNTVRRRKNFESSDMKFCSNPAS
jgi:hypothetical protein